MKLFKLILVTTVLIGGVGYLASSVEADTSEPIVVQTVETTTTTTTVQPTTITTISWYDEPHCDGQPCGEKADSPKDVMYCPATGTGQFGAGVKQLNGNCPREETPEEQEFSCPPDDWRKDDVRIDYAAEADGCGPIVGTW